MGAQQGNMADARQRQMAREGMQMRQERIRQREAAPQTGEAAMAPGVEPGPSQVGAMPPMGGIEFGPGRANRFPEPGSPEYQMAVNRMRSGRR
jgi:hypothetical protein